VRNGGHRISGDVRAGARVESICGPERTIDGLVLISVNDYKVTVKNVRYEAVERLKAENPRIDIPKIETLKKMEDIKTNIEIDLKRGKITYTTFTPIINAADISNPMTNSKSPRSPAGKYQRPRRTPNISSDKATSVPVGFQRLNGSHTTCLQHRQRIMY